MHHPVAARTVAADHPHPQDRRRRRRLIAAAGALPLVATLIAFSWPQSGKAWRVIDGDTLDLAGERIRLFGIDAPERGQSCGPAACGKAATGALADILSAGPVRCTPVNTDRYGRTVARCRAGRHDVNREMVRRGIVQDDPHMMLMSASLLGPDDVAVAFSHSGTTSNVIEAARLARKQGARVIAVTNYATAPLSELADIALCSTAQGSPLLGENAAARIAQLNIMDAIFVAVAQRDLDRSEMQLARTRQAVETKRRS